MLCVEYCQALRPIKPEEELTISYVNAEATEPQRAVALRNYLFRCECDKCLADRTQPQPDTAAQGYSPLPPLEKPRPVYYNTQEEFCHSFVSCVAEQFARHDRWI